VVTGAAPGRVLGSQPYRRLSGDCTRVLTPVRPVKPGRNGDLPGSDHSLTSHPPPVRRAISMKASPMLPNGWREPGKLLISGSAVPDRSGARQRSEDGSPVSDQPTSVGCLENRSRVPSGVTCGAVEAALSTRVDNHVDSSSSLPASCTLMPCQGARR
jgi:hypothetical protein